MRFLLLLVFPLLGTGCLTPLIAKERAARVQRLSHFDSGCGSMRLVDRMGHRRYKLRGCGHTYVYACHDRLRFHSDSGAAAIDALLMGGMDTDAPCHLVAARRDPPPPRIRRPARVVEHPAAGGGRDEPRMAGLDAPTAAALPRLPEPAEVKRVMTGLEPELRRCGLPHGARLTVELKLAATGAVRGASVRGGALPAQTRCCVERQILRARVSPFRSGPVTLAYLFDLR